MKHKATILSGEINFYKDEDLKKTLKRLEGETIFVDLKKKSNNRSLVQNNYYFFMLEILSKELGEEKNYYHKFFKIKFLLEKIIGRPPNIERIFEAGKFDEIGNMLTTTNLSTVEAEDYYRKIRDFASMELKCHIPLPSETEYAYETL